MATVLLLAAGCLATPRFEVTSVTEDAGAPGVDGASRHDGDAAAGREDAPTAEGQPAASPAGDDGQATAPDGDGPGTGKNGKRPCDPPDPECDDD